MLTGEYDVFFSYSHADREIARPLIAELRDHRLEVFVDERGIQTFDDITLRVTGALARSKALLALYTPRYAASRACQFELTAAYIAALQAGEEPTTDPGRQPGAGRRPHRARGPAEAAVRDPRCRWRDDCAPRPCAGTRAR